MVTQDTLLFSQEDADVVFEELGELHVALDTDPLVFGPKRLNQKTAEIRRMLDRCEKIYLDMSQRLHTTRRALRVLQIELDMAKKDLYANDPETRAGRSVSDREAIATGKLSKEVRRAYELETSTSDLESVLVVIKVKRADLRDVEIRLKDQIKLCQEELGLGQHWRSRVPDSESDVDLERDGRSALSEAEEVNALIGNVDEEIQLARAAGTWEDDETSDSSEEASLAQLDAETESIVAPLTTGATVVPMILNSDIVASSVEKNISPVDDLLFPEEKPLASYEDLFGASDLVTGSESSPTKELPLPLDETQKITEDLFASPVVSQKPSEELLQATVTTADVDGFLNSPEGMSIPQKEPSIKVNSVVPASEDFLLDFLSGFESAE